MGEFFPSKWGGGGGQQGGEAVAATTPRPDVCARMSSAVPVFDSSNAGVHTLCSSGRDLG